eukprot:CAMPEP_0182429122 /NCGR_PEP_ID=MMETSP1167-20130531/25533_1 /TAXON_ID=2988 /ORGANISM="Mallomonas Sp, Strain CCMP3275" /LENGTH=242 /DNA_ID=CAMNT_0024612469 /DNA_START=240 /DNA_END=968 /DNA_ORIENTATION=+
MQTIRHDGLGGRGKMLIPRNGKYSNVVIWLHGLGDTYESWSEQMLSLDLKDTKFVLPNADQRSITLYQGQHAYGWSDVIALEMTADEDSVGYTASTYKIASIIQHEIDHGIPSSRILIGGFSQGGALALHIALRVQLQLAGCVALSAWLPLRDEYPSSMSPYSSSLHVLQVHGDMDNVVSYSWGYATHLLIKTLVTGIEPKFETITGLGHSSHPKELRLVADFITERFLAADSSSKSRKRAA